MDLWTFMWVFLSLALLVSILESIHRKTRRRRAELAAQELQEQLRNQPYHVYTIGNTDQTNQQIYSPPNNSQFIRMSDDLPPKYEDLIIDGRNVAYISSQSNIAPSTTTASRDVAIPNVPAQIAVTNIAQNVQPAVTR